MVMADSITHHGAAASRSAVDILASHPMLFSIVQANSRHMIELYDRFPRIARLAAAQQKWLLTQVAYALHLERDPTDPLTGITAARLLDIIVEFGVASRNTATAFLSEMLAYKLVRDVPGYAGKRSRPLEPTEASEEAMTLWFRGQIRSLDLLDGGRRLEALDARPQIFQRAQPIAAKRLIADPAWRDPPPEIACFVWTEYGGLILDDFLSRITSATPQDGLHWVEGLRMSELSTHYALSRTHLRRLFNKAESLGVIGWQKRGAEKSRIWVTAGMVENYKRWQSVKFCALDDAFAEAWRAVEPRPS